jgi:hypothetical protein
MQVLDSCKDRDCFEDVRVYVTSFGEQVLSGTNNVRTKSAELIWAYVGVDKVPFNRGFYQVTVKYYVRLEFEACIGMGQSQTFSGIAVLEKNVVLYGGEGSVTSYSSSPENNYCGIGNIDTVSNNDPVAYVETVEPIVLGTKIKDCSCPCCDTLDIPSCLCECLGGEISANNNNVPRLYVSIGIFSIVKIERPTQILVEATDYSVPDKECCPISNEDNPCALFNTMPFPSNQFRTTTCAPVRESSANGRGACGCGKHN